MVLHLSTYAIEDPYAVLGDHIVRATVTQLRILNAAAHSKT